MTGRGTKPWSPLRTGSGCRPARRNSRYPGRDSAPASARNGRTVARRNSSRQALHREWSQAPHRTHAVGKISDQKLPAAPANNCQAGISTSRSAALRIPALRIPALRTPALSTAAGTMAQGSQANRIVRKKAVRPCGQAHLRQRSARIGCGKPGWAEAESGVRRVSRGRQDPGRSARPRSTRFPAAAAAGRRPGRRRHLRRCCPH